MRSPLRGWRSFAARTEKILSPAKDRILIATAMVRSATSTSGASTDTRGDANDARGAVVAHYNSHRHADSYEDAYFYEPGPYAEALRGKVQDALGLTRPSLRPQSLASTAAATTATASPPPRVLLDVGGGTGNFTGMLLHGSHNLHAVVVDPFLVEETPEDGEADGPSSLPPLRFVKAGAEKFIRHGSAIDRNPDNLLWWQRGYHQVLMKEVIHHIKADDRVPIFQGLREGLEPLVDAATHGHEKSFGKDAPLPPSLLIVTRPQIDIDYPLWEAARSVWAAQQPSHNEIVRDLEASGFVNVIWTVHSHPCTIPWMRWENMVRNRFWSTFSHFSDDELDEGIRQIEESARKQGRNRLDENGVLKFEDRLLFISAHA